MRQFIQKAKTTRWLIPLVCALTLATSGCMTRYADLTVASTKNIKLGSNLDLDKLPRTASVEGTSSQLTFLFIPLQGPPNPSDAVDDALTKADGDLMLNPVFYQGAWWFIFGQHILSVKGEVVKTHAAN